MRGTADRGEHDVARHEKAHLRIELEHYGTTVPGSRSIAKRVGVRHPELGQNDLIALVDAPW
jgi:hypothetical protein